MNIRKDEEEDVGSYWMTLRKKRMLTSDEGSSRSHCVERSLWKRLWTCRESEY
jgi:hypothetical protein